jgi:hypothetical protein
MAKYKTFILGVFIFALCFNLSNAQSLKVIRTDVDSARSGFVTATYSFGIDIVAEGVTKCTGVTFELRYDNFNYVKYSQWQSGAFGPKMTTAVISEQDNPAHQGKIYVGATSGEDIGNASIDNPLVIHVDFVVNPDALNRGTVTISFDNAMAVINDSSSGGKIINLSVQPVTYNIHGFVNVWPGDADTNGIVDTRDFTYIDLYLGYGTDLMPVRSFKRQNASSLWQAQSVLLWDVPAATYADCDGNGEVTVTDVLIWKYNFLKTHSGAVKNIEKTQSDCLINNKVIRTYKSIAIPIYLNSAQGFLGIAGRVSWADIYEGVNVLGIDNGELFAGEPYFLFTHINKELKYCDFAVGSMYENFEPQKSGIIAYLIVEPTDGNSVPNNVKIDELTGLSNAGGLFNIEPSVSGISEQKYGEQDIKLINNDNYIVLFFNHILNGNETVNIYDIMGRRLPAVANRSGNEIIIDKTYINSALLLLNVEFEKSTKNFVILNK